MLLVMWLAGCSLVAVTSAALARADGPWLLGFAAIMAAQVVVLTGRAARLPPRVTWPLAIACLGVCALAYDAADVAILVGLGLVLMLVVDRFAALSLGLSTFAPPDPVAREFARARRDESRLTVASISPAVIRGSSRRLARTARELVPCLRLTDAVVHVANGRLVVVLPGADHRVAMTVLGRVPAAARGNLLLGTATFPNDGQTFGLLKELARSREEPWLPGDDTGPSTGRRERRGPEPTGQPAIGADRRAVLFEARPPGVRLRRVADLLGARAHGPDRASRGLAARDRRQARLTRSGICAHQAPGAGRSAIRVVQAAQHDAGRRALEGDAQAHEHHGLAGFQDRRGSARDQGRAPPSQVLPRRASPAPQHPARGDDVRRAPAMLGEGRGL